MDTEFTAKPKSTLHRKAPVERVPYTIKPVAGDIRVSGEIAVISKAGSAPEKKIDISQSAEAQTVQSVLDKLAGK